MKLLVATLFILPFFFVPITTSAQGIVPVACTGPDAPVSCGTCEFVDLINNVIQISITLATIIATLVIIWGGFKLVTSAGNPAAMTAAKKIITNVLIGYIIILTAFLIINTVLGVIISDDNRGSILNWQKIECIYANAPTTRVINDPDFNPIDVSVFNPGATLIDTSVTYGTVTSGANAGSGGGAQSCSVPSSTSNACHPDNLGCFSDPVAAAKVCTQESHGGNAGAVSRTDRCQDGNSFSFGLWQINILANYSLVPGCGSDFFTSSNGREGSCISYTTNSRGVRYCEFRDCRITDTPTYRQCANAALNPANNTRAACSLFRSQGWGAWQTSARYCGVI